MIIPDINLLVYAHDMSSRFHDSARDWWEDLMRRRIALGLPVVTVLGFVRLLSNPRITNNPANPAVLLTVMNHILCQPNVSLISPGMKHLEIMAELFLNSGCTGKMTTDIHLAALAIEHGARLASNDADFSRFPQLDWLNPLSE